MQAGDRYHMADAADFEIGIGFVVQVGGVADQEGLCKGIGIFREVGLQGGFYLMAQFGRILPPGWGGLGRGHLVGLVGQQEDAFALVVSGFFGAVGGGDAETEGACEDRAGF